MSDPDEARIDRIDEVIRDNLPSGPGKPSLVLREEGNLLHVGFRNVDALNTEASEELQDGFRKLIISHEGKHVVLDLSGVRLMTSPGMSLVLLLNRRLRETGRTLGLTNINPKMLEIIKYVHLDKL